MSKTINTYVVSGHLNWNESNRFNITIRCSHTNNARKNVVKQLMNKNDVFAVNVTGVEKIRSIDNEYDNTNN